MKNNNLFPKALSIRIIKLKYLSRLKELHAKAEQLKNEILIEPYKLSLKKELAMILFLELSLQKEMQLELETRNLK